MSRFRIDPGDCPICGAPHCSCGGGPITQQLLPMRDAAAAQAPAQGGPPSSVPPAAADPAPTTLRAETVQRTLPPGQFTTGTYRGTRKKP